MFNILFFGFGSIAKKHLNALQDINVSFKAYAIRSSSKSVKHEGVEDILRLEEMPEPPTFAVISSPTVMHKEHILKAMELGCPLFIEKPPTLSSTDTVEVLREAEARETINYVGCNLRFLECLKVTKDLLYSKIAEIQEVSVYAGSYLPDWRPEQSFRDSYSSQALMGGGVHLDYYHEFDYISWILGFPTDTYRHMTSKSHLKINAPDYAHFVFSYPHFTASLTLNYFRKQPKRSFEIVGKDWLIEVDVLKNCVKKNGELIYKSDQRILDTYSTQMKQFLAGIQTQNNFDNSLSYSLRVMKMILQ